MDFINIIGTIIDNSIEHVVTFAHMIKDLRLNKNQQDINEDIYENITYLKDFKEKSKGYFDSYSSLIQYVDNPEVGDWAIVKNSNGKWIIYKCITEGVWEETSEEYTSEINLNEYIRKDNLKTINNQSILGEGNIEISGGEHYDLVSLNNNGIMSKEFYSQLLEMKNETLPALQKHLDNTLSLFDENETPENIQTIIDRYNQICEFIESLGEQDDGQILSQIRADINALDQRITQLEQNPTVPENTTDHIFLTQEEYDALTTYKKDTLYIIIERKSSEGSSFGDTFPLIFGENSSSNSSFGGIFPLIFT